MNIDKLAETITAIGIAAIIVAVVLGALASCSTPQPIVQTEINKGIL